MRQTVVAALLGAWLSLGCGPTETAVHVPVVAVKKQNFARIIEADGYLRPIRSTPVMVPSDVQSPMRISWLASNGSVVKKGDPVVRFDDLEPRNLLTDAESRRQVARANQQKEQIAQVVDTRDRRRVIESYQRALTQARAFPQRDPTLFARNQIIADEVDEHLQTARLENAQKSEKFDQALNRNKLGLTQVETKRSDEAVHRAEKAMHALQLSAPHDGVVTIKSRGWGGTSDTLRVGDTVYRSATVVEIARVDQMEVEVFVLEAESDELAKGHKAEVLIEAQPGHPFAAEIKQVETVPKRLQEDSPTQYLGVTLTLANTDRELMKSGERVRARLFLHEQEALVVPRPALIARDGHWVVYRRDGRGRFAPVTVTIGASTAGLSTIESGLQQGDVIALRDPGKAAEELLTSPAQPAAAAP